MQLSQLEYFITVAENQSFSKAARILHISQPSISQQIAKLEEELGYPLLIRNNRGVSLTNEGKILLDGLIDAKEVLKNTLSLARNSYLGSSGSLMIGYVHELNMHLFLPAMLNHFEETNPHVRIHTRRCGFRSLREELISGDIDIGFTLSFSFAQSRDFDRYTIFRDRTYIAISAKHPLASNSSIDIRDLKTEPLIMISRSESPEGHQHSLKLLKEQFGFTPVEVIEADNFETQFLYTASGMGFSLLDSSLISYQSDNMKIFPLTDDYNAKVDAVWYSRNTNPSLKSFLKALKETVF